jgi:putative transposase
MTTRALAEQVLKDTYLRIIGWGWQYLSTIFDDFSRHIIAWNLCTTMKAEDVTETLEMALTTSGCDQARVRHKPRLLSDNGSSYVSGDLAEWLDKQRMDHTRGAPYHPQTQGKIERWHQTLKNPDTAGKLLPAWRSRSADWALPRVLQPPALP